MIISRTPFRISFFGGGTDYPAWYHEHGGAVLSATIDKYCYLTCRYLPPFFEHRYRVVYSRIENCHTIDEIEHPSVRESLRHMDIRRGIEIHHDGDLPARSGMGSSSSFTVGLLHALYALKGGMPTRQRLAEDAIEVEQRRLQETVGSQDQTAVAHGGLNHIVFSRGGGIEVRPVTLTRERITGLESHLMLFYTGIKRTASVVARTYASGLAARERQLEGMAVMVDQALEILRGDGDLTPFGHLLHEGWQLKQELSAGVSNAAVRSLYDQARAAGALGGKLLGAGGGGFMLLFVEPERRLDVRRALAALIHVPFRFEYSGSQIILFDQEHDYAEEDALRLAQPHVSFHELDVSS